MEQELGVYDSHVVAILRTNPGNVEMSGLYRIFLGQLRIRSNGAIHLRDRTGRIVRAAEKSRTKTAPAARLFSRCAWRQKWKTNLRVVRQVVPA